MSDMMQVDIIDSCSFDVSSTVDGSIDATVEGNVKVEGSVKTEVAGVVTTDPRFLLLPIDKPYLINVNQIECVVGEWNKDKTKYGVRIFFVSGNNVYLEGVKGVNTLGQLGGKDAFEKFMSYARSDNEKGDK